MHKNDKIVKVSALMLLAAFTIGTTGCIVGVGNKGTPHKPEQHTLGQELIDLKAAYDSGAIDPDEYDHQRRRLLERSKESD